MVAVVAPLAICLSVKVSCTFEMVAPAGRLLRSKEIKARRGELLPFVLVKKPGPPPALLLTLF